MKEFRDERGRCWTLSLTVDAMKRVKSLTGIDLMRLDSVVDGVPVVQRLLVDVVTIADVAYAIIKPQAEAAGVTDAQFGEALGGDAMRIMSAALMEEIRDFFHRLGRTESAAMIDKARSFVAAMIAAAEAKVGTIDTARILGESFGSSPELQAFRPAV